MPAAAASTANSSLLEDSLVKVQNETAARLTPALATQLITFLPQIAGRLEKSAIIKIANEVAAVSSREIVGDLPKIQDFEQIFLNQRNL